MIKGLSHMTFIVCDLDKTEKMLVHVLDAKKLYDSGDKTFSLTPERFYDIAGLWVAIMQDDKAELSRTYNHIAFQIDDTEYQDRLERIQSLGLEVQEGRSRIEGEGRSIYFYDYDNHLFELHTGTFNERLQAYAAG